MTTFFYSLKKQDLITIHMVNAYLLGQSEQTPGTKYYKDMVSSGQLHGYMQQMNNVLSAWAVEP